MSSKPARTLPTFTPVPRLKARSNGWSDEIQQAFIEALADTGSVEAACRRVNRSSNGAYQLRRHPEAKSFRKAWEAALDLGIQKVEDVAMERALNGVEVPVYSYGKLVGTRRIYNDRLLMFMLRNRAPRRFEADSAKSLSAVDKTMLARLKKQWHKEWKREQAMRYAEHEKEVNQRTIDRIMTMKRNDEAIMSPATLALKAKYEESRKYDHANLYHWKEGEQAQGPQDPHAIPVPSAEMRKMLGFKDEEETAEEEKKEMPGPRIRSLRDDGWG